MQTAWQRLKEFSPGDIENVQTFFAPGRVNLIGEHTDYNGGFVFPAALTLGTVIMVRPRLDGIVRFASTSFEKVVELSVDDITFQEEHDFANYGKGVLWALQKMGVRIFGADFLYAGNLPSGAGLSSSASIEVGTAVAVQAIAKSQLPQIELVKLSQQAENQFVGVNCGIMDQFAVGMGKANHALLLDCERLEYELVPFVAPGYQLVITNTNKRRELADSKYNERRSECERAVAELVRVRPHLQYLAQLSPDDWPLVKDVITDPVIVKRARHVIFEHARTKQSAKLLALGNLVEFGRLMNESHVSLRDDYEVTGLELDALAEAAWSVPGCLGSRMTGAGFGGCTVSLVAVDAVADFERIVAKEYKEKTGLSASFYVSSLGDGARNITEEVTTQLWRFL